jgi:hypothetical protein
MHAVRRLSPVHEIHDDVVANFSADDRAQNTQPLGLRFYFRKRGIGVLDVARFPPARLRRPGSRDRAAVDQITPAGSVVPGNIFSCNIVVAASGWRQGRKKHDRQQDETKRESPVWQELTHGM